MLELFIPTLSCCCAPAVMMSITVVVAFGDLILFITIIRSHVLSQFMYMWVYCIWSVQNLMVCWVSSPDCD